MKKQALKVVKCKNQKSCSPSNVKHSCGAKLGIKFKMMES